MNEARKTALESFGETTGVHDITRIVQRGRDPQTARFTLELHDGREIRLGGIDVLWSQAKLGQVLAVTVGQVPAVVKPVDWRDTVGALIAYATDVEERPEETFQETVRDWLQQYADTATHDYENAPGLREPFLREHDNDGQCLHVHAGHFLKHVRRDHQENVTLNELRQALTDLGFASIKISWTVRGTGKNRKRNSTTYYRAPLQTISPTEDDE